MKLLLATLVFPYPINDGGKSGTFRMIDKLRETHEITLICKEGSAKGLVALKELWPNVTILTFKGSPAPEPDSFIIDFFKTLLGRKKKLSKKQIMDAEMLLNNTQLSNYFFEDLLDIFQKELKSEKYDLVQVDFIELAPLVHFIPKKMGKVFVHHELRYKRIQREEMTLETNSAADQWFIETTKLLEIALLNCYDKVVCLTERDSEILSEAGVQSEKLEVSPLPMITKEQGINTPFVFKDRLLFLGPDQHYPNLDGIDWFLQNCWADILQLYPKLRLCIVGKWSIEKRAWFEHFPNIDFMGFVPDLATVMDGAVMVVPLRIGSGMRMKILEGVAYRVPIISTTIGAEGLPIEHNINCKIADTPQEIVQAVHEVLQSPTLQNQYTTLAMKIINEGYSAEECAKIRSEVYKRVCSDS